jgi:ABC-type branched-subunit amino acid transport system ATPase component
MHDNHMLVQVDHKLVVVYDAPFRVTTLATGDQIAQPPPF